MNKYIQSIIIFSIALPLLGLILLIGSEIGISNYFSSEAAQKKMDWDEHQSRLQEIAHSEKTIQEDKEDDERNSSALGGDVKLKLTQSLSRIGEHFGNNDLQVIDSSVTDGTGDWSAFRKAQAKTGIFKIDSRYETLQDALTRLEVEQPELILQSLDLETLNRPNNEPALEADIIYQAWSVPDATPEK